MTVERIESCFARLREQRRAALVVYLPIGDPTVEESIACARAALDAGADMLELGIPFSDPTADGPIIAAASHRAIQQGGSLAAALRATAELRAHNAEAPIVLFGYYNPILTFGEERFPRAATEAGADGLLAVDLPPEEGAPLRAAAEAARLAVIPLVAPTTERAREPKIFQGARGFLYYVSVTGVTGAASAPLAEAGAQARALRDRSKLPVIVGFGIRTADEVRIAVGAGADGVAVGTEIVRAIAAGRDRAERTAKVAALVTSLRAGLG